jgi:hypothetical protein
MHLTSTKFPIGFQNDKPADYNNKFIKVKRNDLIDLFLIETPSQFAGIMLSIAEFLFFVK